MKILDYYRIIKKNSRLIINIQINNISKLIRFYKTYKKYKCLNGAEELSISDFCPCINDDIPTTPFDAHYFYQGVWALKKIKGSGVKNHLDVGSEIRWVGLLSNITKVIFIDIRPFKTDLKNLIIKEGNILELPFEDKSIKSLSCLHVAEHIGLGRYGDKLDAEGTIKGCKELSRILAPEGNLYFSVPIGKEKVFFNAHRVHSPKTIINYFKDLNLMELSGITDSGNFIENVDIDILEKSNYACGLFWFRKEGERF